MTGPRGGPTTAATFVVEADGDEATVHTIFIPEDAALVSELGEATLDVVDGAVQPAPDRDVIKAAMDAAIAEELGCDRLYPLFGIEFLLCPYPETPGIRICDYGLFDVGEREQFELFV